MTATLKPPTEQQAPERRLSGRSLLLSSGEVGWGGLTARYYRTQAAFHASVPAGDVDTLVILIKGDTPLTSTMARRQHSVRSHSGDIYLVPKGQASEWAADEPCELLHLYVTPALLDAIALQMAGVDSRRVELAPQVQLRDPLVYQVGLALLAELYAGGKAGRLYIESLTQLLAVHLLRGHTTARMAVPEPSGGLSPTTLRRVLEHIDEHLAHELSLEKIAALTDMSVYHFARLFAQSVGLAPHRYITQRRLQEAKRLLSVGTHTVAQVAALTGFADQSHLHRLFKQRFGVTPGSLLRRPEQQ